MFEAHRITSRSAIHSAARWTPFSATDRRIRSANPISTTATTANTQKTSKYASDRGLLLTEVVDQLVGSSRPLRSGRR